VDVLGLLNAAVAMAAFPGGAFAALAGVLAWAGGAGTLRLTRAAEQVTAGEVEGTPRRDLWTPATVAGLAALAMAAALVPLPGSPAHNLPALGAPDNVLAILVLLAAAGALCGRAPWEWDALRLGAAAAAAIAVVALAAAAATFSADTIINLGIGRGSTARVLAGIALLLAAPTLAGPGAGAHVSRFGLVGVVAALGFALAEPTGLAAAPGVASAALALAAAGLAGAAGALLPDRLREAAALAAGAAATGLALTLV
jgi:hypothetical protein